MNSSNIKTMLHKNPQNLSVFNLVVKFMFINYQSKAIVPVAVFVCFVVKRPSQQLWSCRDGQLT